MKRNSKEQNVMEVAERISSSDMSPFDGYKEIPWDTNLEDFKTVYNHKNGNGYEPLRKNPNKISRDNAELSDIFPSLGRLSADETGFLFADEKFYGVLKVVEGSLEKSVDALIRPIIIAKNCVQGVKRPSRPEGRAIWSRSGGCTNYSRKYEAISCTYAMSEK